MISRKKQLNITMGGKIKMSTRKLENKIITIEEMTLCDLKEVANSIINHPDYILLHQKWSGCLECNGYNTNCPRHPDYS
jgi:hypothetical protein